MDAANGAGYLEFRIGVKMKKIILGILILSFARIVNSAELGEDGLHKADWMRETFKDLREDLAEANSEGKRLAIIIEQQNCAYCKKMHEKVFSDEHIYSYLMENFFVVQINMFGNVEVTDFDGEILQEKDMILKWGVLFTPTMMFFSEEVSEKDLATKAMIASMPGAFAKGTTRDLLTWVNEKHYEISGASFQKYHAEKFNNRKSLEGQ